MQTTMSPREWQKSLPSGSTLSAFVMKVRKIRWGAPDDHTEQLELHPCARESAEVLMAQRIQRHSLLDDNPCSG
jgi:hypothetical protein